jgi:Uma2 family endonuclease
MTLRDVKLTIEDYESFPDDGMRHEILDGDHFVTPSPVIRHQAISRNLTMLVASFLRDQPLGSLFAAPCDVYLSRVDVVVPDLVFVSVAGKAVITEKNIQGPPDLLVEILSPGTRKKDERTKRDRYARFGVREYWIVDPELETVKILWLGETGYDQPQEFSLERDQSLASRVLPGLQLSLAQIFAD